MISALDMDQNNKKNRSRSWSGVPAALCVGGYTGWHLTVMYICERSLHYYRDDSMLASVDVTFLTALTLTLAGLVTVLLLLDFEGALSNKVLKWMPGAFMAESGIALCVANANSMKVFSAFTGVAAGFGILAVLSRLLRVKVGRRMYAIGAGLVLGGGERLLATWIISSAPQKYFFWLAIGAGVVALLTVHSAGFSAEEAPLVARAEAAPAVILRKIPPAYILLFALCVCYHLAYNKLETGAYAMLPSGMESCVYEYAAYVGYIAAALLAAVFVKLSRLPMLFVCAAGMTAAAGCLSMLPRFSADEIQIFALLCFAAFACFKACIFLFIIVFSLDRPHPLYYALFGYLTAVLGELAARKIIDRYEISRTWLVVLMLALMPIGGVALSRIMSKAGLSQAGFDHRHTMRGEIKKKAAELELFDREQMMVESIVLDGYDIDELASKMLFSRNTVKVLLRPVMQKLRVGSLNEMRSRFEQLTREQEQYQERVQEAESKMRSEKREENVHSFISSWRARLYKRDAAREAKAKAKAQKSAAAEEETSVGGSGDNGSESGESEE